ncbi:uncharacterized protein HMPREF1541_05689 [Cyphellophora europaea CBS 101466]|uniref:Chromo domain-containing protein n=1 Tax=Cyphellophora europaea (strain CBS 101466) TaxID=1220924 RepID=W2RT26_CYPE1|nr:uncharacterized protein HMPREF1541_05689 [Cyphellophora europaea CBS 101466]ETN39465.1 hypothetical protein HMPREF1541_05689 [Cyphellophora europaea CBS 101466]
MPKVTCEFDALRVGRTRIACLHGAADENSDLSDASDLAHDEVLPKPSDIEGKPVNGTALDDNSDSSDDDDDDEEAYQVESIVSHKGKGKNVKYEIKWVGYPESDNTFEPQENLLPDAREILSKYHEKIGHDPSVPDKSLKKSKVTGDLKRTASDSPGPNKRQRTSDGSDATGTWLPRESDWEKHVHAITHIEKDVNTGQLVVFINWQNGKKTKVSMNQVYAHCPRPMLKFYEQHL